MRIYPKIDLYLLDEYVCSTNQSKTCKEARERFIKMARDKRPDLRTLIDEITIKYPHTVKARKVKT
jgi:hypothetical protein